MFLQLIHAVEKLKACAQRPSGLELIFLTRLDDREYIQSVKSVWSILRSGLKADVLPTLENNDEGCTINTQQQTRLSCLLTTVR